MEQVSKWFLENKRDLPWREGVTPYKVVVSEIMLQQTRATFVIPYFLRWMERFNDLKTLSLATEDEVIKLWEGLGYYSRAKNLLHFAKEVVANFDGEIPKTKSELLQLKGIGEYTAGAILAFGYQQKSVALDGNVTRVIARYVAFEKDAKKHAKELAQIVEAHLPDYEPHVVMEGLIELGAAVCIKKPKCEICPLKKSCLAYKKGIAETLPILPKRKEVITLTRFVACIVCDDFYLVKKEKDGVVMASLYQFPFLECEDEILVSCEKKRIEKELGLILDVISPLKKEKHSYTRYKVKLLPFHFTAHHKCEITGFQWVKKDKLKELPFSSGHRKILSQLLV